MDLEKKIRVLIAEDNPDLGEVLGIFLSSKGLEPILVGDGNEALESIKRERPDLLLTDIEMPEKDGLSLIRDVRKLEDSQPTLNHLPIIVLSGRPDKFADASRLGANDCFSKSVIEFGIGSVIDKIKELIHGPFFKDSVCNAV